ncbi:MAG: glutamate mutase L [Chloroflexota bacterium]|nr:glutamate mutase L [Chloroflexota bacterium]
MSEKKIASIVAADVGSILTHVCLIDRVEGIYRLVARAEVPTSLGCPEDDVTVGLRRAVERLEQIAQRRFLDQEGGFITPQKDAGEGVDAFVATASAASPLKCAVIGLTNDLSIESAQHACRGSNATVSHIVTLGARPRRWRGEIVTALREQPPEVIVMVGGLDRGPTAPLEQAARVLTNIFENFEEEKRPILVFAGNQEARRPVADRVSTQFDLRVVDNVRPSVETESLVELQRELAGIYAHIKLARLPGYRRLREWSETPVVSTADALSRIFRFMARRNALSQGVLGVDVGGASTYVGAAQGEKYQWTLAGALGTSHNADGLSQGMFLEDIARWLPVPMEAAEVVSRLENGWLRPRSVPQTLEDLYLCHAVARQNLLAAMWRMRRQHWAPLDGGQWRTTPPFDLIAVRGGCLTHTPKDGLVMLSLLDALQPTGLARLAVDWASVWPQLGALATSVPLAATQVLERDAFRELGTIIAPIGRARDGEHALQIKVIEEDGQVTEWDLPAGVIRCIPLSLDEEATIEVRPSHRFDIGLGRAGVGGRTHVRGGELGIIVDTRGRPLVLPQDAQRCRAKLQEWLGSFADDADSP